MLSEFSGDLIQWLRGFYYTAQTGSMTAAAELMNRNQSTITHQVKSLEAHLGVKLFSGRKGKRALTPEGQFLFARCLDVFSTLNDIQAGIGAARGELQGEVSIMAFYTVMEYWLPERIAAFHAIHPKVRFNINGGYQRDQILSMLYSRECDLAFMSTDNIPPDLQAETILESELVLVSPRSGPLAVPSLPALEYLAQLPFLSHPDNSALQSFMQRNLARHGLDLRTAHIVSHCSALKRYVTLGMGVAVLDRFVLEPEDEGRFYCVPLSNYFPKRGFGLIRKRDSFLSAQAEAFIRYLRDGVRKKEAAPAQPDA